MVFTGTKHSTFVIKNDAPKTMLLMPGTLSTVLDVSYTFILRILYFE